MFLFINKEYFFTSTNCCTDNRLFSGKGDNDVSDFNKLISIASKLASERGVTIQELLKDDEYGYIYEYEHEIAFFNNKEDAEEYKEDFESNYHRLGNYTYYSSKIITINDKMIY